MFLEMYERNLPLNIITKESKRKRWQKSSILIFILVALLLLFVIYSFPTQPKNYDYAKPLKFNRDSNVSRNFSSSAVAGSGNVTLMPTEFNQFLNLSTITPSSTSSIKKEIWLDYCNLTDIDPWDSTIIKFIQPQKDHMLGCKPKIFQHSKLIDGHLFIFFKQSIIDLIHCQMRCLFPRSDRSLEFGNWSKVMNGTKPECDVIEVECRLSEDNKKEAPFYKYLHAQIYRNGSRLPPSSINNYQKKFDVHLIVLDSVSHTQFIRSMPKTLHILREKYDAIAFSHLNKNGVNSYYNGFGFLMGKAVFDIPESPFSRGHIGDFPSKSEICKMPLDEEQFIGFRYQDDGYVTMMAEDWATGIFNWPNCKGFLKTPVDHYMRPFQLRLEKVGENPKDMAITILKDSCREYHYDIMDYLKNFLKTYPDKPKFSISWMSVLTHNYQNALSSTDDYFYRFFKDTQKDFENSFLFVMGDHGLRFGEIRETKIGEMEDNNPALFLSVPKLLRNDATFMNQLKMNSKELISHYDIYATLNGIAQPKNPRISNPIIHGSSLLHPLPYPRTCDSLRIPFEYCKCRVERDVLPKKNKIGIPAAKLMVEQMNFNLSSSNETAKLCAKMILNKTAEIIVEDYGGEQTVRVYRITFSTIPGNGKFVGTVSYDPSYQKFEILSSMFSRLDTYGPQAKCAKKSFLASYCFCIK